MPSRRLSDEEKDEIAQLAADRVLASDEFKALVRDHAVAATDEALTSTAFAELLRSAVGTSSKGSRKSAARRASDARVTAARAAERASRRRQTAADRQREREAEEAARAERIVELWAAGVPRVQIAEELGFSRKKFDAEVERLRREGEERLAYRPGVD
jgi:hypothetical protein